MVSVGSTSSVMFLPVRVLTKICIVWGGNGVNQETPKIYHTTIIEELYKSPSFTQMVLIILAFSPLHLTIEIYMYINNDISDIHRIILKYVM